MKSGGGARSGIGISAISPLTLDAAVSPAVVTIDGVGFQENVDPTEVTAGARVVLTSVAHGTTIESDGTVTLDGATPDRKMTVSFPTTGLYGDYTVEIRDRTGATVAAWVNAINVTSVTSGTIRLASAGSFSANEDSGSANIIVERVGGSTGAVSVQVDTADGTATLADNDYAAVTGQIVSWADGEFGQKSVPLTINADTTVEPDETVTVALSNVTGTTLDTPSSGALTIVNDDTRLEFSVAAVSIAENAGPATITVNRVGSINGPVSVDYISTDGTATAGSDYTALSGTLSWADQEIAAKSFTVTLTDDTLLESNETVTLTLSNTTGGATIGGTNPATLTILDDDTPDTLQFDASSYVVNENSGTATLNVVRTGNLLDVVSISFFTADVGAVTTEVDNTNGLRDYEPVTSGIQTLSWGAGVGGTQTLSIAINEDTIDELDIEGFTVTLDPVSVAGNAAIGTTNATSVSLTDNDSVLAFGSPTYSVNENGVSVTVDVTRTDLSNTFPGAVSVQYDTVDGTAVTTGVDNTTGLRDFEPVTAGALNWVDGDSVNKTQSFTLTINDDTILEGLESFGVNLSNAAGDTVGQAAIGAQSSTTVDITDDEQAGQIRFVSATFTHSEDAGGTAVTSTATISVERVGGASGIASVDYATADNTAVSTGVDNSAGLRDYEPATNTLTWTDGVSGIQTFTVTVNNDDIVESPDELLDLTLSIPLVNGGAYPTLITGAGAQATATLTITDSVGTLQYSAATYSVSETGGSATITVTRVGGTNGAVAVNYATADGSVNPATASVDYTAASGTLNWATGIGGNQTFTVPVTADAIAEVGGETVDLSLSNVTGAQLGTLTTATLTILDSIGTLQFDRPTYSVNEDGGIDASITVTRDRWQ